MDTKKLFPGEHAVRLRVVGEDPVPGALHKLQDAKNVPVGTQRAATGHPLAFELEVRGKVTVGCVRWLGDQVRREGPVRRFVYVAIGTQAGDVAFPWGRRMKIDLHAISAALVAAAVRGKVLEVVVTGTGVDGTPACATGKPQLAWHAGLRVYRGSLASQSWRGARYRSTSKSRRIEVCGFQSMIRARGYRSLPAPISISAM